MRAEYLRELLERLARGETTVAEALSSLRDLPYTDLGYARVDNHRELRTGFPEIVFAQGKADDHLLGIVASLVEKGSAVICTRVSPQQATLLCATFPDAVHHTSARIVSIGVHAHPGERYALLITAGSADIPVAEEARVTAECLGTRVRTAYDAGVAGLHRLMDLRADIAGASVIIAVAGMEGALPGVAAGLARVPVIAVPTSVGYGANLGGLTPLFTMLSSCANGVSVVNIDNGFGAGYIASQIVRMHEGRE